MVISARPQINKEIKSEDGEISTGHWLLNSQLSKFELKTEALTAGRPKTTSFVVVDPLPTGYKFDLDATKAAVQVLIQLMMKRATVLFRRLMRHWQATMLI